MPSAPEAPDPLGRAPGDHAISVSADSLHHVVRIGVWWYLADSSHSKTERAEGYISPEQAFSLAANLVTAAHSALRRIAADHAAGDCATCQNLRLIEVPRSGGTRTEKVSCPDCRGRFNAWETTVPTVPAWRDNEPKVLSR